jgi:hypothetical protein
MAIGGLLAGAMMAQTYSYPYAYGAPVYGAPVYAYPQYRQAPVRKQVIIKNSPGARVYEEDDFGW